MEQAAARRTVLRAGIGLVAVLRRRAPMAHAPRISLIRVARNRRRAYRRRLHRKRTQRVVVDAAVGVGRWRGRWRGR